MLTIRDLQAGDIEPLAELHRQFWNESADMHDTQKMREVFDRLRDNDAYILLCAVEGDRLAGSVMGIVCDELFGDCRPFLLVENMVVDRAQRRKGVGKALFAQLEARAKAKGCRQIILVTESDREDACGFYPSIGFHPTANKGFKKKL